MTFSQKYLSQAGGVWPLYAEPGHSLQTCKPVPGDLDLGKHRQSTSRSMSPVSCNTYWTGEEPPNWRMMLFVTRQDPPTAGCQARGGFPSVSGTGWRCIRFPVSRDFMALPWLYRRTPIAARWAAVCPCPITC